MPDPTLILEVLALTAVLAGLVLLLSGLPTPARLTAAGALAVGGAFYLGCRLLGLWPRWPPREDQDRFLLIVLPAAIGVELVAAFPSVPRWLAWALRLAVAAAAAPVLLHNSTYLADLGGEPRKWAPPEAALILAGLAAALAAVWALLALLVRLTPGRSVPLALSLTCAAAAVTVMLSGYATGGQLGLPLAAALGGVAVASFVLRGPPALSGALGVGVVGLFSLLVIGRFFGALRTEHAVLLGLAPLLCWLPELPYVRRVPPWARGLARLALVAAPLALAVVQAQQRFVESSAAGAAAPAEGEPTLQDYLNFGK
jgi:hypothetical protein